MARRQWTVVFVADDDSSVRQLRLSREVIRVGIALALFVVAGLSWLVTAALVAAGEGRADAQLVAKNTLLERELGTLTLRLDTLQQSLVQLSEQDEYYRLLAGLEPLGADVQLAGIGGPDADRLETRPLYRVDAGIGRETYETGNQLSTLLRRARLLAESWREAEDTLSSKHERLEATPSIYPVSGYVSSLFSRSRQHPILDRPRAHQGIDIVAPHGTPVVASAKGRVITASEQGEYGLLVEIDHGFGTVTRYAHLSQAAVNVGQVVERGARIGRVGQTGLAVGPHLHYEVLVNGAPANPRRFILDTDVIPD
jgi:murein DD-endopeptidase MepM/ murein hydrolase activator NlpD